MDTENNDNEQQPITSSASSSSSSNNSSSSNLLVNLPMLPMLHSQDDDDDGVADIDHDIDNNAIADLVVELAEEQQQRRISLNPASPIPPPPLPPSNNAALSSDPPQNLASTTDQPPQQLLPDNSIFISPLLFNNNSSSSSSTSSPPLPPPHHNPQHHYLYHQAHSEHPHLQQQPPSSSPPSNQPPPHQHHVPLSPSYDEHEQQQEQHHPSTSNDDDNAIADTIDASTVEADDDEEEEDINLNANIASTSSHNQQQQQPQPSSSLLPPVGIESTGDSSSIDAVTVALGVQNQTQQIPPITLPLLVQNEAKPATSSSTHSYSSHFSHHPYHLHHYHQHYPNFGLGCGSNTYNFDVNKNNNNGAIMFSNNDNNSGPSAASCSGGGGGGNAYSNNSHHRQHHTTDRLKLLYPNVNENETPLPRCWSVHDKCLSIGLSQNNLRVHYKGVGKQHNDAASVRTTYPIPAACGLYYFEVKIISKGKNGYMGIGLTAQQFRMNRLPGWDKQSYGYHGDDGNSFSSSGNGQSYGPTFTTGDVIGCCVNFVNNTCFYTKNGIDLGIAFRDLPSKLYPTVGLQTPGEEVDANFGQEPFKFDQIEDMMKQMRSEMKTTIYNFPMTVEHGDPTTLLHKMVSSYLVHNGYSQTAEAFGRSTGQTFSEEISSIRNRQKILKLVMSGKMGQAIEYTLSSYPGLLENNKNLWFMLKCRQFIEMVNGSDIEYCPTNNKLTNSTTTQTQITTPPNQTSVIQSTKSYQNGKSNAATTATATTAPIAASTTTTNSAVISADNHQLQPQQEDLKNSTPPSGETCSTSADTTTKNSKSNANMDYSNDIEMENHGHATNGNSCKNGNSNIFSNSLDVDEEMDIDVSPSTLKLSHGIERILEFGKELSQMGQQLEKDNKMNEEDRQMLEDAFSLIAYSNPWSSPLGWQLCPTKRESACTALNSAILESMNYSRRPPLDVCVAHASELLKVMANSSLGACAFMNIEDVFPQN